MEQNKKRMSQPAIRPVVQLKIGKIIKVWDSIRMMCDALKLDRRAVQRCLHGKDHFRSVKGFEFRYVLPHIPVKEYKTNMKLENVLKLWPEEQN